MIQFVKFILIPFIVIASNAKKNLCNYCKPQHKGHGLVDLSEFNYKEESKNKLEEQIKNIEKKIIDLDIIKEEIISEIDKIKTIK